MCTAGLAYVMPSPPRQCSWVFEVPAWFSRSLPHSHADGCQARCQPVHRRQRGVQCHQGHSVTSTERFRGNIQEKVFWIGQQIFILISGNHRYKMCEEDSSSFDMLLPWATSLMSVLSANWDHTDWHYSIVNISNQWRSMIVESRFLCVLID